MKNESRWFYAVVPAVGLALALSACASKKYVRGQVDPVRDRVETVENRTGNNAEKISGLEDLHGRDISRVEERARAAEQEAQEAGEAAARADEAANRAHALAEHGVRRVDTVEEWVRNLNDYRLTNEQQVLFGLDQHELSPEAKGRLDQLSQSLAQYEHYALEVRGFTDTTGPADYNLALSRKRADAVVRYLTTQHQVPLFRIHVAGLGDALPAADNSTREGRMQNRRVQVRLFVADYVPTSGGAAATATLHEQ